VDFESNASVAQRRAVDNTLFIQFARSPQVGQVKTRLVPALGEEGACALHCELVRWTSRTLVDAGLAEVELHVAGELSHPLFQDCLDAGVARVLPQRGRDLGERMHNALADGLRRSRSVVLVGSDCPGIGRDYLAQAGAALERAPVVIGPALDGGYVLIGARDIRASVFQGVDWGTGEVYRQTVENLRRLGWRWEALAALADIDRPQDLALWQGYPSDT
jgi:rSAM/selenodomain-associated transferase 1